MTSPTALYVFTITIIFGLQYMLVPTNMLTQGGPNQGSSNIVYIVYQYALVFFQTGKSAAFAMVCMAIYVVFLLLKSRFLDKRVHYEKLREAPCKPSVNPKPREPGGNCVDRFHGRLCVSYAVSPAVHVHHQFQEHEPDLCFHP